MESFEQMPLMEQKPEGNLHNQMMIEQPQQQPMMVHQHPNMIHQLQQQQMFHQNPHVSRLIRNADYSKFCFSDEPNARRNADDSSHHRSDPPWIIFVPINYQFRSTVFSGNSESAIRTWNSAHEPRSDPERTWNPAWDDATTVPKSENHRELASDLASIRGDLHAVHEQPTTDPSQLYSVDFAR